MKKLFTIISAAALLMTASCSENKPVEEEIPPDGGDTAVETTAQNPFREYTDQDFTDINVNLRRSGQGESIPLDIEKIQIDNFITDGYISPCKAEDVRRDFLPEYAYSTQFDIDYYTDFCENPCWGYSKFAARFGDTICIALDFDNICMEESHDMGFYTCDTSGENVREVYHYSSIDEGLRVDELRLCRGELYGIISFIKKGETSYRRNLCRITSEGIEKLNEDVFVLNFLDISTDKIYCNSQDNEGTTAWEFDPDTGEMNSFFTTDGQYICYGGGTFWAQSKSEERTLVMESDNCRISTSIRGNIVAAADDRVYVTRQEKFSGYENTYLYTYDLNRMERYISDISSIGNIVIPFGDGVMVQKSDWAFFMSYFIPDLGQSFNVPDACLDPVICSGVLSISDGGAFTDDISDTYVLDDGSIKDTGHHSIYRRGDGFITVSTISPPARGSAP
ncbi:MAG: hypothetical protein J6L99_00850 [Ruminococcus sp.]|nr:hypothetical protein [Ruminococcus sp.]